jgi:uncharacterized membrane protein
VLKNNSLAIPQEYILKLRGYDEQIKSLQERLNKEKMLLDYLHSNFLKKELSYSSDLLLIAMITLLIDAAIYASSFEEIAIRIIGLPVLLLFPGYALLAIIFPSIEQLDLIERTAFSLVLSIAVMLLLSFGLNSSSLKAIQLLAAINMVIFTCLGIALLRRQERFSFSFWKRIKLVKSENGKEA